MLVREGHRRAAELGYGAAQVAEAEKSLKSGAEMFIGGHGGGICRGDEESISRTAWRSRPGRPGKRTLQITLNCPELCRRFHNFSIRHLPDMRRVEWLKKNSAGSREAVDELK